MKLLAIPLDYPKTVAKWLVISETRRDKNFSVPHMIDTQVLKFFEQRRIATEFGFLEVPLPVHLIMAAYIKQNDFLFRNHQRHGNAITVSKANGITTRKLAAQRVQF